MNFTNILEVFSTAINCPSASEVHAKDMDQTVLKFHMIILSNFEIKGDKIIAIIFYTGDNRTLYNSYEIQ